jgi:hypothetical protein
MKIQLLFIYAIMVPFLPIDVNHQDVRTNSVTTEEHAVYSALLDGIRKSPNDGKEVELLVINDRTQGPYKFCFPEEIAKWDGRVTDDELKPLFENLIEKNKDSKPLNKNFKVNRKYVLLRAEKLSSIFKRKDFDSWVDFYKKYPASSGYITFSRVGFNSDEKKAVIYRETNCGFLCGYGGYILLSKDNGTWKVISGYGCWQS